MATKIDLGIVMYIFEVTDNLARDILYIRMYSNYQEDLGVYFHIQGISILI